MPEPRADPPRTTGRRVGRERVLEAAIELLRQADLADLLAFLGTRAVADAADVRPATVHHHFANPDKDDKPNRRLANEVLKACLHLGEITEAAAVLEATAQDDSFGPDHVRTIVENGARNLRHRTAAPTQAAALFLAAIAAPNDPVARDVVNADYADIRTQLVRAFDALAGALERRYDTAHGWSAETLALYGTALSDGLVLHHQYDPDAVDPDLFGEVCLRLFEMATVPADEDAPTDPITERLLARVDPLDLPEDSGLDQHKRSRIIDAARALYDADGASALTVSAVAREAGVSRGTVLANFGDRNGLAVAVWARHIPELELRLESDRERELPLGRLLERHLSRLIDRCTLDRELSGMVMEGIVNRTVRRGLRTYEDPNDPRGIVPLARLLVPALMDATDELWPGLADTHEGAYDLAAMITHSTMVRALARRDASSTEAISSVMDVLLDGMLRRATRDH